METKPHTVYGGKLERSDVTGGGEGSEAAADSRVRLFLNFHNLNFWWALLRGPQVTFKKLWQGAPRASREVLPAAAADCTARFLQLACSPPLPSLPPPPSASDKTWHKEPQKKAEQKIHVILSTLHRFLMQASYDKVAPSVGSWSAQIHGLGGDIFWTGINTSCV